MKKIEAIIRPERLEQIKAALEERGIVAMTVIEVRGRGEQKGIKLQYRGGTLDVDLLPKIKLEIYAADPEVDSIMKAICDAGRTIPSPENGSTNPAASPASSTLPAAVILSFPPCGMRWPESLSPPGKPLSFKNCCMIRRGWCRRVRGPPMPTE